MAAAVVEVEQLGKQYRTGVDPGAYATLRDALSARLRFGRGPASRAESIWALRNVNLTIDEGEVVGIIGRNGAGKTTLLKLLTKITQPTEGVIRHRGRIGALLEVGTGFHPELTGERENIYLNGAILGMHKPEIERKFDEIVDFAGVAQFLDTPMKRYSSGMRVRLAFAVAAHLEPEILAVDEVLAVGDISFQRKSLGKMGEVAAHGRTVLFVSHNLAAVESLCTRACWIDQGQVISDGPASAVVSEYVRAVGHREAEREWKDPSAAPGNEFVRLRAARAYPVGGTASDPITVRTPFVLEFEYDNLQQDAFLNVSLHLYSAHEVLVLNAVPVRERDWYGRPFPAGRFRDRCYVPGDLLNAGNFRVELMLVKDQSIVLFQDSAVLEFDVQDVAQADGLYGGTWSGVVRPTLEWETERLS